MQNSDVYNKIQQANVYGFVGLFLDFLGFFQIIVSLSRCLWWYVLQVLSVERIFFFETHKDVCCVCFCFHHPNFGISYVRSKTKKIGRGKWNFSKKNLFIFFIFYLISVLCSFYIIKLKWSTKHSFCCFSFVLNKKYLK